VVGAKQWLLLVRFSAPLVQSILFAKPGGILAEIGWELGM